MIADYNNQSASYAQIQAQQQYISNQYNLIQDNMAMAQFGGGLYTGPAAGGSIGTSAGLTYTTTSTAGPSAVHAVYSYGTSPSTTYVDANGVAVQTAPKEYAEVQEFIDLEDL